MTWPWGHQYQRSPLSPGVPLEGSDTVLGLRQIEQLRRAEILKQSLGVLGDSRQQYERYKGPYLSQLTAEHLQQQPRPWPEFMYASRTGARDMAYNVPSHTRMLWERMEENMVYFVGNYFMIAAAFGVHLMLQYPLVLVSVVATAASGMYSSPPLQRDAGQEEQGSQLVLARQMGSVQNLQWLLIISAYMAFFVSGCGAALLRCVSLLASVILLHAALRRAATEYRCRKGQTPGVPFRLVLGLHRRARVGEDPHRMFRELCWAAVEAISSLSYSIWFLLRDYWCATWDDWILRRSARTTFI